MRITTTTATADEAAAAHRRRRRAKCGAVAALAVLIGVPAAAIAGRKATAGTQTLQLKAQMSPNKAAAKPAALKLNIDYESTKPNQHNDYYEKYIRIVVPPGFKWNPKGIPTCSERALDNAHGNAPAACPASSQVGGGSVTADARPTLATPIPATVAIYNSRYDCTCYVHPHGAKKGSQDLIFYVHASVGATIDLVFNVLPNGSFEADFNPPPPPSQRHPSVYALKTIDITIKGPNHNPFIQAPATCKASWPFAITIANFDGPDITAHDKAACSSGKQKAKQKSTKHTTTKHEGSGTKKRGDGDNDADDR